MKDSRTVKKAEDFITHTTKAPVVDKAIAGGGKLNVDKWTSKEYNHLAIAEEAIAIINTCPNLSKMSRAVMNYRILNPKITDMGVALSTGLRITEVRKYEQEGKQKVTEFLKKTDLQNQRAKFSADEIIQNELRNMNKQGKLNPMGFDTKA